MNLTEAIDYAKEYCHDLENKSKSIVGFGFEKDSGIPFSLTVVYSIEDLEEEGIDFWNVFYEGGIFGSDEGFGGEIGGDKDEIINAASNDFEDVDRMLFEVIDLEWTAIFDDKFDLVFSDVAKHYHYTTYDDFNGRVLRAIKSRNSLGNL